MADSNTTPLLEFVDVSKIYRMGQERVSALDHVSTTIEAGEFTSIMGTSGSGKSTLMNVMGLLDAPTSGEYLLRGKDVSRLSRGASAKMRNQTIGFVFQSYNLLARTSAVENVALPLLYRGVGTRERNERAANALRMVGLGERLDHTPAQMSGGQQQRVAIARATVTEPAIILADEPTGNLDTRTTFAVMDLLADLADSGITVVMVTHEPEVAALTRRIVWMRDGKIVADHKHTPGDEVETPDVFARDARQDTL